MQLYAEGASIDELLADMGAGPLEDDGNNMALESAAADNELVKFVNKVIIDAYNQKASDIHVEPLPGKAKTGIRFRVDGALQPYIEVPAQFRQALVTRLKIMCDLDISEKRKPQDGRLKLWKAAGCEKCNQTGYKGRLGLHELLVVDDDMKRLVQERARVADLFAAALEAGMRTLKMDGMEKVMLGMTDLKQVRSVCIK